MEKQQTLVCQQGGSDKVYEAAIVSQRGGFVVNFAYGRRGQALHTGSKTAAPVSRAQAETVFDKLVKSKLAKGYTPAGPNDGTAAAHTPRQEQPSRWPLPQLLNPVLATEVSRLLVDHSWLMQEKHDGMRLLLRRESDGALSAANRRGMQVALPAVIRDAAANLTGSFLLDGEITATGYHVFDLLETEGADMRPLPYQARLFHLSIILADDHSPVRQVTSAFTPAFKTSLFDRLREEGREGVVFKRVDAPVRPGRPPSGGDQLKWKFYESASFVVRARNAQRSVSLGLIRDGGLVAAGNVTIPPNHPMPEPGQIVEVRYLYALRESGAVYQPVFIRTRPDLTPEDCAAGQLKFKPRAD